jgi:two-component system cell cycle sensor histidine kinase/response regulator CckA
LRVDPQQIEQVLINLVQNAADSIGTNGSIVLRCRTDSAVFAGKTLPVSVLEISDTGAGIAPEVEKRLFDPFFTTKCCGTGLGLPIAACIVEKHGGLLQYKTNLGSGTTFSVVLPSAGTASMPNSEVS